VVTAQGGHLWHSLRRQEKRCERYKGGHDQRDQIPDRCPIIERPESVERHAYIEPLEGDAFIGAARRHPIVTLVKKRSGFAAMCYVDRKTSE
jgi:IS30 family transposase